MKTLLAGPSPTSPMKAEITISPISNIPIVIRDSELDPASIPYGRQSKVSPGAVLNRWYPRCEPGVFDHESRQDIAPFKEVSALFSRVFYPRVGQGNP